MSLKWKDEAAVEDPVICMLGNGIHLQLHWRTCNRVLLSGMNVFVCCVVAEEEEGEDQFVKWGPSLLKP